MTLNVADAEPESSLPRLRAGELDVAITFDYPTLPEPEERDLEHTLAFDGGDARGAARSTIRWPTAPA